MEIPYTLSDFEREIQSVKPRFFDNYLLAPFMLWFAVNAKKPMGKWPRRMLFSAGVYMVYRNWTRYKNAIPDLQSKISELSTTEVPV